MTRIDPYSLALFLATAREKSISRAAQTEHIAPSALSRRIADLERAFGLPLLTRSPMGVELTEAGQYAVARIQGLHDNLASLVREMQSLNCEILGSVRLFANASAIVGYLPERLKQFQALYAQANIALEERSTADVIRACLDDKADLGVGVASAVPPGMESWHFAYDPLMVVLPAGHELSRAHSLKFAEVLRYPLVVVQPGGSLHQLLHAHASALRAPIQVSVTVNSFDGVCRMVEAGLGVAVIPTGAASAYAGSRNFVRRVFDEPWRQRELKMYALRKTPRLRVVEALIKSLILPDKAPDEEREGSQAPG